MAEIALAALVRAWQTTTLATVVLVTVLALSRIRDSAVYVQELPTAFSQQNTQHPKPLSIGPVTVGEGATHHVNRP